MADSFSRGKRTVTMAIDDWIGELEECSVNMLSTIAGRLFASRKSKPFSL